MFKFLPSVFYKRDHSGGVPLDECDVTGLQSAARPFNCRVLLLDESELTLVVKVSFQAFRRLQYEDKVATTHVAVIKLYILNSIYFILF